MVKFQFMFNTAIIKQSSKNLAVFHTRSYISSRNIFMVSGMYIVTFPNNFHIYQRTSQYTLNNLIHMKLTSCIPYLPKYKMTSNLRQPQVFSGFCRLSKSILHTMVVMSILYVFLGHIKLQTNLLFTKKQVDPLEEISCHSKNILFI